jgi:hypothetical protein
MIPLGTDSGPVPHIRGRPAGAGGVHGNGRIRGGNSAGLGLGEARVDAREFKERVDA